MRKLGEYVARTILNGGEFIKALDPEDLGFEELNKLNDPPENVNVIRIEKWKTVHKNWNAKQLKREEANKAAFAIIFAQCSEGVRNKMKTHNEWRQIKDTLDTIGLANLIYKAMYLGTATESLTQKYLDAEVAMLNYRRGQQQSNLKYIEAMKSKVKVYEQMSGEPGISRKRIDACLERDNIVINQATHEQTEAAKEKAKEEFVSYLIVKNCHPVRYRDCVLDLRV